MRLTIIKHQFGKITVAVKTHQIRKQSQNANGIKYWLCCLMKKKKEKRINTNETEKIRYV